MQSDIDFDTLNDSLRRCGATWDAAQAHGLLSSRLAIIGVEGGSDWLQQVLDGSDPANALRTECENLLNALFQMTYRQLSERLSEFTPLLPDDGVNASNRAMALGHWCEGFLHGLVSANHGDMLKQRLAADPLADIIRDMLQITRAVADEDTDDETNDGAYVELVEYLRVAAQLTYEELAEFRKPGGEPANDAPETLH
jgi:yecA family protein